MTPISVAVVGDGPLSRQIRDHGVPLGRIRRTAADDPAAVAVLVDVPPEARAASVAAALRAGRIVLCPPPVALDENEMRIIAEAARVGRGKLLPGGEITHCEAGRHGCAAIRAENFGALRSLYLAVRQPRDAGGDVLDHLLPEALDAVLALVHEPFSAVRVNVAALFGAFRDTAVILFRGAGDVVVTIELARCLPPTLPAPGLGEVEIDAIGAAQAVRIVPQVSAVRAFRDGGTDAMPWVDPPVLAMFRAIEAAVDAPETATDGLARATRALALTKAIRAAL